MARMKVAEKQAEKLIREMKLSVPVDVYEVARLHKVAIVETPFESGISGLLMIEDDKPVIGVNSQHHINRRRFTAAHELGHYLLHASEERNTFIDTALVYFRDPESSEGTIDQEIEANAFAAALLMPAAALREELLRQEVDSFDELAVGRLAAKFAVSPQALTIRLARLGLTTAGSAVLNA